MFGSPETTPGGRALKFYSTIRLDVRKIENLKDGTEVVGSRTRVKVEEQGGAAVPAVRVRHHVRQGHLQGSLLDVGVDLEIVKKSGAWFTYEGEQLGQGRENAPAVPGGAHRRPRRDRAEGARGGRVSSFDEGADEPIRLDDADAPPPEEPPADEAPAAAGKAKARSSAG